LSAGTQKKVSASFKGAAMRSATKRSKGMPDQISTSRPSTSVE
jgi:hypothetical protein